VCVKNIFTFSSAFEKKTLKKGEINHLSSLKILEQKINEVKEPDSIHFEF
jgi:hypothetical protein